MRETDSEGHEEGGGAEGSISRASCSADIESVGD